MDSDFILTIGMWFLIILAVNVVCYIIGGFIPVLKNSSNRVIIPFFIILIIFLIFFGSENSGWEWIG